MRSPRPAAHGRRPRVLFVTYYRVVPTGMIGVFKRCIRLISRLTRAFDIHLVSFGPLPEKDALFSRVRREITVHEPPKADHRPRLAELMRRIRPAVVVLGETPRSGALYSGYRAAADLGLRQVGIENYYNRFLHVVRRFSWRHVTDWAFLGIHESGRPSYSEPGTHVLPPLVTVPEGIGTAPRDRLCVIGYDRTTLVRAIQLVRKLPAGHPVSFFTIPELAPLLRRAGFRHRRSGTALHVLPDEEVLYGAMARARLVFGKAGFQQIMEGLCLGAPVVCQNCAGGVQPVFLGEHLRPFYRLVETESDLDRLLPDLAAWLLAPPVTPWVAHWRGLSDVTGYAAERFGKILRGEMPGRSPEDGARRRVAES